MCALIPLLLLVAVAPWPLGAPLWLALLVDAMVVGGLAWLWYAISKPVEAVGGVPVGDLPGHPCPACGATRTVPWMQGRLPLGLKCEACGRRSGAEELAQTLTQGRDVL